MRQRIAVTLTNFPIGEIVSDYPLDDAASIAEQRRAFRVCAASIARKLLSRLDLVDAKRNALADPDQPLAADREYRARLRFEQLPISDPLARERDEVERATAGTREADAADLAVQLLYRLAHDMLRLGSRA